MVKISFSRANFADGKIHRLLFVPPQSGVMEIIMKEYRAYVLGKEIEKQSARVSAHPFNQVWSGEQRGIEQTEIAYFVSFDSTYPVTLEIEVSEDFDSYELRPLSKHFEHKRDGRKISIRVDEPCQFVLEIDGSHNALHIFANPVSEKPRGDFIYYGKGEHNVGLIWLESNQTLYIDEGAVVYGVVYAKDAENVRIMGRGVLDASPYRRGNDDSEGGREVIEALLDRGFTPIDMKYHGNLVLNHCKNCLVEGIVLRDAPMWSTIIRNDCENIVLDNIKIIGQWRYNSDGINICTSKNVTVKNCFVRSFDDCIITRGAYLEGEDGNVENVTVENCVLWCDWGKSLETWCGHKPTEIRNIVFRNNYLIHLNAVAMNITVWYGSDRSVVDNVLYENIFIDVDKDYLCNRMQHANMPHFEEKWGFVPRAVSISVEKLGKMVDLGSQKCENIDDYSWFNVKFSNVTFKNVRYFGNKRELGVVVKKHSDVHKIENIRATDCDFEIEGWG